MKAVAVFPATREVRLVERDPPQLGAPDEVRLRILEVGICGTDREICSFEYGTPPPGQDHLVIGHEALGEVVEVGDDVEALEPGDLVVPTVRRPCPHPGCRACRAGHQDFCYTGDFTERGIKGAHGYLTEYVVDQAQNMVKVPSALESSGVLTEPLTIAEKALEQVYSLMQRRPPWIGPHRSPPEGVGGLAAVVLGAGPVGLLGAMALVTAGFTTAVYSRESPSGPRARLVEALGARYVCTEEVSLAQLADRTGNIDLFYEAVGHSRFALEALRALGSNGIYVLTGVPSMQDLVETDPARAMRDIVLKNQVLLGTVNAGPGAFAAAVDDLGRFAGRWPREVEALIADRHPIEEAPSLIFRRPTGAKSVITLR